MSPTRPVACALLWMACALSAAADPPTSTADSTAVPDPAELARRIDLLAREIDDLRLGEVAAQPSGEHGLGPAASKVYSVRRGVSIGGYGEMRLTGFSADRQDGVASGLDNRIDFVRQILYVGYKFDDKLLFNSEIEFEHASTETGGSVSVEFATIEALLDPAVGLRAGLLLVPLGLLNELHEPPVHLGTQRPQTEQRIIPTTWRANGAGIYGDVGTRFAYRAYVLESLDAMGFESSGLREGRQNGSEAAFEDVAVAARADYSYTGILAGGAFFRGRTSQGQATPAGVSFGAATTIWDVHFDAHLHGARLRALVAGAHVGDAASVNALRGLTGDGGGESVGSGQLGWYAEAGYDLLSRLRPRSRLELVPYVRYEEINTQRDLPAGFVADPAQDQQITTAGLCVYPHPQVVVKTDYLWVRNEARTGTNQWNASLGYLF